MPRRALPPEEYRPEQVYELALRYLSRRDYAENELRRLLLRRGVPADLLEPCIEHLREMNYLCDERFVEGRIRTRRELSGRGRCAVRSELRGLGLDGELVDNALDEQYGAEAELLLLRRLAEPALSELRSIDDPLLRRKRRDKLLRRLLSRGFTPAAVFAVVGAGDDDDFF